MPIRDPIHTELPYRPELTFDERSMLVEWAIGQKYAGDIRARGTDPNFPGSTYWDLLAPLRVTLWPERQRLWATHSRRPDDNTARILHFLRHVLATHPPTRH